MAKPTVGTLSFHYWCKSVNGGPRSAQECPLSHLPGCVDGHTHLFDRPAYGYQLFPWVEISAHLGDEGWGPSIAGAAMSDAIRALTSHMRRMPSRETFERLLADETFRRELAHLRDAERRYRNRGVDIREYLGSSITHPFLTAWQTRSDERSATQPGRADLRRARRRGILRILDDEIPLPLDLPDIVALPATPWRNAEWRTFKLIDELEYLEMIYVPCDHPLVPMRPAVDLLSHRQARAILGWRASTLDYWISSAPHLIGGLRQIEITPEVRATLDAAAEREGKPIRKPRRTLHRVVFQTLPFMIWVMSNQN